MGNFIDLTGQKFGRLRVVSLAPRRGEDNRSRWECVCDCGVKVTKPAGDIKSGNTRSCGCLNREKVSQRRQKNLTGMRFGRLVVTSPCGITKKNQIVWRCECLGSEDKPHPVVEVRATTAALMAGKVQSCKCLQLESWQHAATKRATTVAIQKQHGSLAAAARKAKVSPAFLGGVASGEYKCRRTYAMVKQYVLGGDTPDARGRRSVRCDSCGSLVEKDLNQIRKSHNHFCNRNCYAFYQRGGRFKPVVPSDLLPLMDAPKRPKERRKNPESVEIQRITNRKIKGGPI
ncbi:MAG: hypothetical protein EOO38_28320 [Cytophagaceae bacterium]|nr:MAG: hypothetical protein EOO38_28320 [Cytophagaceae bacterium]